MMGVYGDKFKTDTFIKFYMTGYEGNLTKEEEKVIDEFQKMYMGTPMYHESLPYTDSPSPSPYYDGRQWCNNMFMSVRFRGRSATWQDFPGENSKRFVRN